MQNIFLFFDVFVRIYFSLMLMVVCVCLNVYIYLYIYRTRKKKLTKVEKNVKTSLFSAPSSPNPTPLITHSQPIGQL